MGFESEIQPKSELITLLLENANDAKAIIQIL